MSKGASPDLMEIYRQFPPGPSQNPTSAQGLMISQSGKYAKQRLGGSSFVGGQLAAGGYQQPFFHGFRRSHPASISNPPNTWPITSRPA